MEVIKQFGVQPILLAAQVVNFLILLFLLRRFMYKPLLSIMEKRKLRIAEGLKNADEVDKRLQAIEEERIAQLKKAAEEAKGIILDATKSAGELIEAARQKAQADIKSMIQKNQEQLERDREQMYKKIRIELSDLVIIGLKKVADKSLTEKDKKTLVKDSIEKLV